MLAWQLIKSILVNLKNGIGFTIGRIFNQKLLVNLTSNYREMATNTTKRDILFSKKTIQ